jgi:hypothetical protein
LGHLSQEDIGGVSLEEWTMPVVKMTGSRKAVFIGNGCAEAKDKSTRNKTP